MMGRKPIRLERALDTLSFCMDAQGFVKDPCVVLQSRGMQDGSLLIKKLAATKILEIRDATDGGRITLIKILPCLEKSPVTAENSDGVNATVNDGAKQNFAPQLPAQTTIAISDNWKNATYCHAKLFELLKETAKTLGTYPNIEEPMLVLQKHGFKQPSISQYLKQLRLLGCIETIVGEGKNGRGIAKIIITKENLPTSVITVTSIKTKLPKSYESKVETAVPLNEPVNKDAQTAPLLKKHCRNRVMAFLDLENLFITLEKKGLELDALKLKNVCDNYGSFVQLFSLVSVGTYQRAELAMEKIIAQGMPITLIKNGKNSVDSFIAQLVEKALQNDIADTFIIGTHDGGIFYQETIKKIKAHNKVFKLLTVDAGSAKNLRDKSSNGYISAAPKDNQEYKFKYCIRRWTHNNFLETNTTEGQFVKEVVSALYYKIPSNFTYGFFQLARNVWNNMDYKIRAQFRQVDCEYAISALHHLTGIIKHSQKRGRNGEYMELLYMNKKHPLLTNVLSA